MKHERPPTPDFLKSQTVGNKNNIPEDSSNNIQIIRIRI